MTHNQMAHEQTSSNRHIEQMRVLIVDDEPMLRSVIQDFLGVLGFPEPLMAGNGLEALEVIRSNHVDVAVSDIRMPEMELEELLKIVQREFPQLIVIATSGYSDFDRAYDIISKGAHDFLGKPLNLDILEVSLRWVSLRRAILARMAELFGQACLSTLTYDRIEQGIAELESASAENKGIFQPRIDHALRLTRLGRHLPLQMAESERLDLLVACLLHELVNSYQIHVLYQEPRALESDERQLIHVNTRNGSRLIANVLGRPELEIMIGNHLDWQQYTDKDLTGEAAAAHRVATWLGLLNCIEGCLSERPDRPAFGSEDLRESFKKRMERQPIDQIRQLLDCWDKVEEFYKVVPTG
jgi:CheY-like chemotaxis protein